MTIDIMSIGNMILHLKYNSSFTWGWGGKETIFLFKNIMRSTA